MARPSSKVNPFHYLDYRQFLRDWYHDAKSSRASFSYRSFSKLAGFSSPNFLKLVMEGKRNLTPDSLGKFMKGLRLNKQEQDFFRNLVLFNQAKSHGEKDRYYQKLLQSRKFGQLKPIEKHQYEYYSTWYHPVIRELVVSPDFDGTATWLVQRVQPTLTIAQVEKSLDLLEKLGFIKKAKGKRWKQSSSVVSTGPEVQSLILFNYHKNLLDLSKEILSEVPPSRRDISAMTLGVVKERLPLLKKRIQEFRQEILKMVSTDTHPEEVVQLNIQLFPMTVTPGEEFAS